MKKVVLIFLILLIGCAKAQSGVVDFSTLAHENYASGITGRINEVFTDPISFETFWKNIYRGMDPIPDTPKINFAEDMVIAVSPGEMPTGGYDVEIVKVTQGDTRIEVTILMKKPSGGVTEALTQPHHIIKLKKSTLPVIYKWMER